MIKSLIKMTGILAIASLLTLGCDSMVDADEEMDKYNQINESQTVANGALITGNVVTVTEEDLGPSDRPLGFPDDYEVPEEDWYTPTHGGTNALNTPGATFGFIGGPDDNDTYGNGSFLFDVPAGERSWILTDQYGTGEWHGEPDAKEGARLDEITTLKYSTYISDQLPDGTQQTPTVIPSMQIMAQDSEGDFLPLIFDPPADAITGEWQEWNATEMAGWRTEGWAPCQFSDGSTWDQVIEACEGAKVLWAVAVAAGTWPNKDFHGYTDLLTVGVNGDATTFDFEPLPATKDDCKNGGWEEFGFSNQGQCIRYVNTGKDRR